MFGSIGSFVYRMRYTVIAVLIALMGGLGLYGMDLPKHLSQSGWFDPNSESVAGSVVADTALGRDHKSDVILLVSPPEGTLVDDAAFNEKMQKIVDDLLAEHPNVVSRDVDETHAGLISPFDAINSSADQAAADIKRERMWTADRKHGFISIGVAGNDDTTILNNYKQIEPFFTGLAERYDLPGTQFELAGLQPIAGAMSRGMDADIRRAEVIALPVVALMLLFVFGGVVAAILPVFIGGLTIAGSLGITKLIAQTTELNIFAQSVITLIGLGIAIDYGLFMVSRFREELAEGYTVQAAVRRSVMTSGQTIVFSATIIVAALACLLMFPQAFLKSVAFGAIASVALAALLSVTVLPAILAILGRRVDALSLPFLRRTRTREEVEAGFWGKLATWVMKHPLKTAIPTVLLLLALIIPFGNIAFGGLSEKLLPPDNSNRVAQEHFDTLFPTERTEELKLVVVYDQNGDDVAGKLQNIADAANEIPGFTKQFSPNAADGALDGVYGDEETGLGVTQMSAGLLDRDTAAEAIKELRAIDDQGLQIYVAGTPALTQDSIDSLMALLPYMAILLVTVTGLLMFLVFGSIILPIKAALMTALGLGSTLGILTWIFIDGHGSSIANFTPGPLFAAILVLIIAIIYGLSTDYEIFLLSRMVEARQNGASTTEAIRVGTAHTGGIITAAAAILVVVTGAFGLSDIVMMKYIAYGMIAALVLDATVIRMLLVPSVMKLLGDDCWWSPRWMQRLQQKIGLGETTLADEPDQKEHTRYDPALVSSGGVVAAAEAPTTAMRSLGPDLRKRPATTKDDDEDEAGGVESTLDELIEDAPKAPSESVRTESVRTGPARTTPTRKSSGPDTGSWKLGAGGVRQTPLTAQPTTPQSGPQQAVHPQSGPQQAVRPQSGPQRAVHPQSGPQRAMPPQSGPQQAVTQQSAPSRPTPAQQPAPQQRPAPQRQPQRPPSQPIPSQPIPSQPTPAQRPQPARPAPAPAAQPRPATWQVPPVRTPAPPVTPPAAPVAPPAPPTAVPTPPAAVPTPPAAAPTPPVEDVSTPRSARELRPDRGDEGNQISVQELLRRSRARQADQD